MMSDSQKQTPPAPVSPGDSAGSPGAASPTPSPGGEAERAKRRGRFSGLYRNELLKLRAQAGFRAVGILALALSLLIPVVLIAVNAALEETPTDPETDWLRDAIAGAQDPIERAWFEASLSSEEFFTDRGIPADDWRVTEYESDVDSVLHIEEAMRLISTGSDPATVAKWFSFESGYTSLYADPPFQIPGRWDAEDGIAATDSGEGDEYSYPTREEAAGYYSDMAREHEALSRKVKTATVAELFRDRARTSRGEEAAANENIAAWESAIDETSAESDRENLTYLIEQSRVDAQSAREVALAYEECARAGYDYDDWHVRASTALRSRIYEDLREAVVMGEHAYLTGERDEATSYENYVKSANRTRARARGALALLDDSLKNNIPIDVGEDERLGGRGDLSLCLKGSVMLVTLFFIVASAMCVSREHTDGTIRLLLIRPRSRGKILLSKYLALLTYGGGMLALSFLVQAAVFAVRSPLELLSMSNFLIGQHVFHVPALLGAAGECLLLSGGAWALFSIAFFFAVLTRRTLLAILLPLLFHAGSGVISTLTVSLLSSSASFSFLRYTALPYLNIGSFLISPLAYYQGGGFLLGEQAALGATFPIGYAQILLAGALFTALAFVVFRRQEVKN